MSDTVVLIGLAIAVILGVVAEIETRGRNWAGWACIIGFGVLFAERL